MLEIAAVLAFINVWTMLRFWQDKARAVAGRGARRIPERELLTLAFLGGTPAAFVSRRMFRHKTRKQPFSTRLQLIAAIQIGAITGYFLL